MNISIGTPPFTILAIADTGSDLTWTQCLPCKKCFKQKASLFDPKQSSTYKKVSCSSSQCHAIDDRFCPKEEDNCSYSITYADDSYTKGEIAIDTLALGSTDGRLLSIENATIGCGNENNGIFEPNGSGIIGLGTGSTSLISQLGKSIDGKFSNCLTSRPGLTSKINFGTNAVVSGDGVVTLPLVKKHLDTMYALTLESITVGDKKVQFLDSNDGTEQGNIMMDLGATLTLFPSWFYSDLELVVASTIKAKRVQKPKGVLTLCYNKSSNIEVPGITFNFKGGDVKLDKMNTFVSMSRDLYCFAFAADDQFSIYGNVAQKNFLVGYDIVSATVSFKMTNCAIM